MIKIKLKIIKAKTHQKLKILSKILIKTKVI